MRAERLSDAAIASFKRNWESLAAGATGEVPEASIVPVEGLPTLDDLRRAQAAAAAARTEGGDASSALSDADLLKKTAMLKLNGGLGTSMGLDRAKSLLPIKTGGASGAASPAAAAADARGDVTFLDVIARQVAALGAAAGGAAAGPRFVLMNSFSTSADCVAALRERHPDLLRANFAELLQNKVPKVDAGDVRRPAAHPADPSLEWCPPGHGDVYAALGGTGLLDALLADGVEYLFVSNADNLGAELDAALLRHLAESGAGFVMEVCGRTAADRKGGHLCRRAADGRLTLRESAMCPAGDAEAFQDTARHRFFNTNNLWLSLPALRALLDENGGALPLPMIRNAKTVDPRDPASAPCLQLETAMGSAIECFERSGAVVVPRSRFVPVKTCSDLLVLRSDAYAVDLGAGAVRPAARRGDRDPPTVSLDAAHYRRVDQLDALVPIPPSLVDCDSLVVAGPWRFAVPGLRVRGRVVLDNPTGETRDATEDDVRRGLGALFGRTKTVKVASKE